jgi:hypothetical protein
MVVENHKLPRVQFRLSLDNMPYAEGDKRSSRHYQCTYQGTTKTSKMPLMKKLIS